MKKVVNCYYFHWSDTEKIQKLFNEEEKKHILNALDLALDYCKKNDMFLFWDVMKIDKKNLNITFIQCKDFDKEREPEITLCILVKKNGEVKVMKGKGQIYHAKYMFVKENYDGFNIEESKKWYDTWNKIIPKEYKKNIGYKKNWIEILKKYNLPIE